MRISLAPAQATSAPIENLAGLVERVTFHDEENGFCVLRLVEPADLVIAHNAKFDRAFRHKAWACSVVEVKWREIGFEGAKLGYLVNGCGLFHHGHRAVDDCHALLEVVAHEVAGATSFSHLLRSSTRTRARVWAERAPFDQKDVLRARGYRWSGGGDGRPKA